MNISFNSCNSLFKINIRKFSKLFLCIYLLTTILAGLFPNNLTQKTNLTHNLTHRSRLCFSALSGFA